RYNSLVHHISSRSLRSVGRAFATVPNLIHRSICLPLYVIDQQCCRLWQHGQGLCPYGVPSASTTAIHCPVAVSCASTWCIALEFQPFPDAWTSGISTIFSV